MTKRLALAVYLKGRHIGTAELNTHKSLLNPWNPTDGIQGCIALVCFHRNDDLLAVHSFDEFSVKGVSI